MRSYCFLAIFAITSLGNAAYAQDNGAVDIESSSHVEVSQRGKNDSQKAGDNFTATHEDGKKNSLKRESISDSQGDGMEMQDAMETDASGKGYEEAELKTYKGGKLVDTTRYEGNIDLSSASTGEGSRTTSPPVAKKSDNKTDANLGGSGWRGTILLSYDGSYKCSYSEGRRDGSERCTVEVALETEPRMLTLPEGQDIYMLKQARVTYTISGTSTLGTDSQRWSARNTYTTTYGAGWLAVYPKLGIYAIDLGNVDYCNVSVVSTRNNEPPKHDIALAGMKFYFIDRFKNSSQTFSGSYSWSDWPKFQRSDEETKLWLELTYAANGTFDLSLIPKDEMGTWIASHQFPPIFSEQLATPYSMLEQPKSNNVSSGSITRSAYWSFRKV